MRAEERTRTRKGGSFGMEAGVRVEKLRTAEGAPKTGATQSLLYSVGLGHGAGNTLGCERVCHRAISAGSIWPWLRLNLAARHWIKHRASCHAAVCERGKVLYRGGFTLDDI